MKSSTAPYLKGIVLDANVLSLLAKENRLDLLKQYLTLPCYIASEIYNELEAGLKNGVLYLKDVLQLVEEGHLEIIAPTAAEIQFANSLPAKLGRGEAEAIAICHQQKFAFITHDRKAANYCDHAGIVCIRLRSLLAALQNAGLLTASEAKRILAE